MIRRKYKNIQDASKMADDVAAVREDVNAHIKAYREIYVFTAGVLVGIVGSRLLGRPAVMVNNYPMPPA